MASFCGAKNGILFHRAFILIFSMIFAAVVLRIRVTSQRKGTPR